MRAFSYPGCRFTRDGRAIVNYWTCEYRADWRMQDRIDLRAAVIPTKWFYESPAKPDPPVPGGPGATPAPVGVE